MKDEEMAEEIANKRCHEIMCYGHCSFNSPKHHRCGEWHREYNCALEGIKAGRPQWHEPEELPPKEKNAPNTSIYVLDQYGQKVYYSFFYKVWKSKSGSETKVTHWCEIPTFDKE